MKYRLTPPKDVGTLILKILQIMKKSTFSLFLLSFTFMLFTFSCQQSKKEIILEYSCDIERLLEQGYVLLDESHEEYDYIMSLLVQPNNDPNQATSRGQFCQWDLPAAQPFPCDSGSGGTCTVFVMTGAPQIRACLVCVGGTDNGNADCI